ncbi:MULTISPECIES: globin domain-containing protein [Paenibacillus]|uniref:globin domain-containing protein n=1 Tax=Paenibacillus TaxID=44249 RepID=UPI00203E1E0B|nr:globin [Paenibacillus camelliae]MCM3632635.1 globin [Paenibacillus camelliae]
MAQQSTYELIGGADTIRKIVEAFYPKVQKNPEIGPLFPEDITPVMEKQYMFLTQFFGGPMLYTEAYGHPMMRARHMPFPITEKSANAWLSCMKEALAEVELSETLQALVLERLSGPAYHFINTAEQE